MTTQELIQRLESEWEDDGFLGRIREGSYSKDEGQKFIALLKEINISENTQVPKRLLSLVWYLPSFLEWQKERVKEKSSDSAAYERFVTDVLNCLEQVLGVP